MTVEDEKLVEVVARVLAPRSWLTYDQAVEIGPRNDFIMQTARAGIAKSQEQARAAIAAYEAAKGGGGAAGWVMVPREPTPEMVAALRNEADVNGYGPRGAPLCYRAMLAAAPAAPPAVTPTEHDAVAAEREACAAVSDRLTEDERRENGYPYYELGERISEAIRARKDPSP